MFKITKTNVNQRVIFDYNDIQFRIGDEVIFIPPDPEVDSGFFNSNVGKLFKDGTVDSLKLVIKEAEWLEIIFELSLVLNGKELTNAEKFDDSDPADGDWNDEIYTENGDYRFIIYLTNK